MIPKLHLLTIPQELRDSIIEHVLSPAHEPCPIATFTKQAIFNPYAALCLTNKALREQTLASCARLQLPLTQAPLKQRPLTLVIDVDNEGQIYTWWDNLPSHSNDSIKEIEQLIITNSKSAAEYVPVRRPGHDPRHAEHKKLAEYISSVIALLISDGVHFCGGSCGQLSSEGRPPQTCDKAMFVKEVRVYLVHMHELTSDDMLSDVRANIELHKTHALGNRRRIYKKPAYAHLPAQPAQVGRVSIRFEYEAKDVEYFGEEYADCKLPVLFWEKERVQAIERTERELGDESVVPYGPQVGEDDDWERDDYYAFHEETYGLSRFDNSNLW